MFRCAKIWFHCIPRITLRGKPLFTNFQWPTLKPFTKYVFGRSGHRANATSITRGMKGVVTFINQIRRALLKIQMMKSLSQIGFYAHNKSSAPIWLINNKLLQCLCSDILGIFLFAEWYLLKTLFRGIYVCLVDLYMSHMITYLIKLITHHTYFGANYNN